ncbi:MAG: hypothetical protein D3M94_09550 [Rhodocyclales bacterium GT-UBC]|nr:MAG: hypothetical protein D3M94_09550 [Rhodocyclales bacterium GT-UBC]
MRYLLLILTLWSAGHHAAWADSDPTRPPATWLMQPGGEGDGSADPFRLQSVLWPQQGKPVAIIGGQVVQIGGKVGGSTLVKLSEHDAVLRGADGITRLYLTPDVEKQMIVAPGLYRKGKSGQGKDLP